FFPRPPPRPRPTKPTRRPPTTIGRLNILSTPVLPIEATKSIISKAEEEEVTTASVSQLTERETSPTEESTLRTEPPIPSPETATQLTETETFLTEESTSRRESPSPNTETVSQLTETE
ncbi:GSCOCG00013132001-RA-CDS, partial [Cotesia congregata]